MLPNQVVREGGNHAQQVVNAKDGRTLPLARPLRPQWDKIQVLQHQLLQVLPAKASQVQIRKPKTQVHSRIRALPAPLEPNHWNPKLREAVQLTEDNVEPPQTEVEAMEEAGVSTIIALTKTRIGLQRKRRTS